MVRTVDGSESGRHAALAAAWRELRSAGGGLLWQAVRFVLCGAAVAVVYLLTTLLLSDGLGVTFQLALAIGFATGVALNFTLQRTFVWRRDDRYALALHHQAGRYVASAVAQYAVTAVATSLLPSALGLPRDVVYVATVAIVIPANFLLLRHVVFKVGEERTRANNGPDLALRWSQPRSRRARSTDVVLTVVASLVLAAPALFTRNGFNLDFTNHLWAVWVQEQSIRTLLHPSYFLNTSTLGVFYPYFAFYGGPLYASTGAAAAVLGATHAFDLSIVLAAAAAYGGLLWLARQCGVRSWLAHAPAITFATSAYYVTDLYGRGAWPEFVAVSSIPLLVASGAHLMCAARWSVTPTALFVASVVYFTGSHNITLLWGLLVFVLVLAALCAAYGSFRRRLWSARTFRLGALAALACSVNAWYLVPDVRYASDTAIGGSSFDWAATSFFDVPSVLFDPFRSVPSQSTTPALYVQTPMWMLAWAIVAAVCVLGARRRSTLRRAYTALGGMLGFLLVLLTIKSAWTVVPSPLKLIQFPYRLSSYVALTIAGLVLLGAIGLERGKAAGRWPAWYRVLRPALAAMLAVSVGLAIWQLWVPETRSGTAYADRRAALVSASTVPRTWYDGGDYDDRSIKVVAGVPEGLLAINPEGVHGDRASFTFQPPPGPAQLDTNIAAGPYLVSVAGLTRTGRTASGYAVVRRSVAGGGPIHVTVRGARSALLTCAWAASLLGFAGLVAIWIRHLVSCLRRFYLGSPRN